MSAVHNSKIGLLIPASAMNTVVHLPAAEIINMLILLSEITCQDDLHSSKCIHMSRWMILIQSSVLTSQYDHDAIKCTHMSI